MRNSAIARLGVMAVLTLILLIPLGMVSGVVGERASRRNEAVQWFATTWGGGQTVTGPVLTVPYTLTWKDDHGQQQRAVRRAHFLPKDIQFDASLVTTQRERGIFHMIVYSTELAVRAQVHPAGPFIVRPPPTSIEWGDVTLSVGISDPKALTRRAAIDWNGRAEPFTSGIADVGIFSAGIQARGRALDSDIRSSQRPHVFGSWELGVGS